MATKSKDTVKDLMSLDLITVTLQDNIYEIAVKMKENDIGFIPVVEGKKLIGIVTDRDLVLRGYAEKHSGSTSVSEVMTTTIESIPSSTPIDEAARIMSSQKIRRLPVVDEGEIVGVVALADLAIDEAHDEKAAIALSHISENTDKGYADGKIDYSRIQ